MVKLYRRTEELEPFADLHADLDDQVDRRFRIRLQLNLRCDIERFNRSLGRLKAWGFILLAVSLVIWAAYSGIDPIPIIKELLAGGLNE